MNHNSSKITETETGVCLGGFRAKGLRGKKYGLMIISNSTACETAAVFTKNYIKAAPVIVDMERISQGAKLKVIVANSGCANACTAQEGIDDAKSMCAQAADALGISELEVGVSSTGLIGSKLDMNVISSMIDECSKELEEFSDNLNNTENLKDNLNNIKSIELRRRASLDAARAIMTTDTKEKMISVNYRGIEIGAIAKGAGMIAPDMATMLCFITTNAKLSKGDLQGCLTDSVEDSFNMLVIDGEMSTNDTVMLLSECTCECSLPDFKFALDYVTKDMAKKIAQDGEGATKFIEVEVRGAERKQIARAAAKAIASSSLVKTAIYGENPNWGRIAGKLGSVIELDFEKTDIFFEGDRGRVCMVEEGMAKKDIRSEAEDLLRGDHIKIIVNLNSGDFEATAYGCDMTEEYIRVNAEYN